MILIGAFGFFNVQKTLLLQIVTSIVRWTGESFVFHFTTSCFDLIGCLFLAFIAMIVLACVRLLSSPIEDHGHPPVANVNGLPNLFGACVYSFMCHHVSIDLLIRHRY